MPLLLMPPLFGIVDKDHRFPSCPPAHNRLHISSVMVSPDSRLCWLCW